MGLIKHLPYQPHGGRALRRFDELNISELLPGGPILKAEQINFLRLWWRSGAGSGVHMPRLGCAPFQFL